MNFSSELRKQGKKSVGNQQKRKKEKKKKTKCVQSIWPQQIAK